MKWCKFAMLLTVAMVWLTVAAPRAQADVGIGINIGVAPNCPYGYYPVAPYNCAPFGYYGPEWFVSGVFIGAGPWYHGPEHFRGRVDRRYDWHRYRGRYPERGEHPDWGRHDFRRFRGNERMDQHGRRR